MAWPIWCIRLIACVTQHGQCAPADGHRTSHTCHDYCYLV
jgi:hypothetical protein